MKTNNKCSMFLTGLAALAVAAPASAVEPGAAYRMLAKDAPVVELTVPAPSAIGFDGRFCWTGAPGEAPARLGMPASLCVSGVRISKSANGFAAVVSGRPFVGVFPASHLPDGRWTAVLFQADKSHGVCSDSRRAGVNMEFSADGLGYLTGVPSISAYYEETPDNCHTPYETVRIAFSRSDLGAFLYRWSRPSHPLADRLGMSAEVSLKDIYVEGDNLVIPGDSPVSGVRRLSYKGPAGGVRTAEAVLFSARTGTYCTEGSEASVSVNFPVGPEGAILGVPVLKAVVGETWDVCHSDYEYTEIPFVRR
ncbi:MAG: hypothetical protein FD189_1531 [Elusimicrobia bacterium]|nr:MAG: hypothetical protein FD154_872 [Elusimicrobiota bacterium]KAF0155098.1 MAG: hypothetical protein FD189_1531 [Elusimicrobiota bacterium]